MVLIKEEVVLEREKNNSLISKKSFNSVETKEENHYRKFQFHLVFLLFIVNQSLLWSITYRVITLIAIYHCGQEYIELDDNYTGYQSHRLLTT